MREFLIVLVAILTWGCYNKTISTTQYIKHYSDAKQLNKKISNADAEYLLSLYSPHNEFPLNISLVNNEIWYHEDGFEIIGYRPPVEYTGHSIQKNLWYIFNKTKYPEEQDYYAIKKIPLGSDLVCLLTRMPYGWLNQKVILFIFNTKKKVFVNNGIEIADYEYDCYDCHDTGITTSRLAKNNGNFILVINQSKVYNNCELKKEVPLDSLYNTVKFDSLKVFQFTGRDFILIKGERLERPKEE